MFSKKLKSILSSASEKVDEIKKTDLPGIEEIRDKILGEHRQEPDLSEHESPPTILYQSLIKQLTVKPETGILTPNSLDVFYLPSKDINGKKLDYDPSGKNPNLFLLKANLIKVNETEELLTTFYFNLTTLQKVVSKMIVASGSGANNKFPQEIKLEEEGKYEMHFFLGKHQFYNYAFTLTKTKIEDAYSPVPYLYTIGGEWENKGVLRTSYDGNDYKLTFQPLISYRGIHIWTDKKALKDNSHFLLKSTLKKNCQVIGATVLKEAKSDDIFSDNEEASFFEYRVAIGQPLQQHGELEFLKIPAVTTGTDLHIKLSDLEDGVYEIELEFQKMADRPDYIATYPFEIKSGKVVTTALSDNNIDLDKTSHIEAGRDFQIINRKTKN